MKKLLLLLFFGSCFIGQTFSQTKVTLSKPYPVVDGKNKMYYEKDGELLKVTIDGKRVIIQTFDTKTLTQTTKNEYEDFQKGFSFEEIVELNNRFYFFYSVWDKPNEIEQLFCKELDFKKGALLPKETAVIKVQGKLTGAGSGFGMMMWSFGVTNKFDFQTNFDNTSLLIKYRKKPIEKKDSKNFDVIGFYAYTTDLSKPLWSKEHTMPYTEALMDNLDYGIDKKGNAYLLAAIFDQEAKSRDDVSFHLELMQVNAKTTKLAGSKIEFDGKSVNKIWVYENPKGFMMCAGFYSNDKKYSSDAKGIFALKVDATGKIYDKATYDIPAEVINMYASKKQKEKNEKKDANEELEFADLILRSITFQEDGSIILFGEQHFIETYSSGIPLMPYYTLSDGTRVYQKYCFSCSSVRYEFKYNDMFVTKIDANGKLAWMKKLPKKQKGMNSFKPRGGMGYYSTSFEGKHYLLFLDNVKNVNISKDEVPALHIDGKGGFLTSYTIDDKTGAVSKASMFDSKNVEGTEIYQFDVDRIQQINGNEFVLEAYKKGKEDILIKVNLKK